MSEPENTTVTKTRVVGPSTKGMRGKWKNPARREQMLGVGIAEFQKEPDARILRPLLLEGKSPEEIGDALGYKPSISKIEGREIRRHKSIRKRLRKILGFEDLRIIHGAVMNTGWFSIFWENFGQPSNKQLAAALGTSERHVWDLLRKKDDLKLLTAEFCEKVRGCERKLIAALMSDRGRPANHFKSVVPDLVQRVNLAAIAITRFREVIEKGSEEQDRFLETLAAEARREVNTEPMARKILCSLPTLAPWLNSNLAELERKPKEIAVLFLAHDYAVKIWVVQNAAYSSKFQASARGEIRAMLFPLGAAPIAMPTTKSKKLDQPKKTRKDSARTIEKGQFCDQVQREMRTIKAEAKSGGRTIVEIERAHPDFLVWKVRDALAQEDRDHFNHPRQWAAVIGYAEIILGKHYDGKSAQTVRDWVKAYRSTSRKSAV
jgi:hypothetical protein